MSSPHTGLPVAPCAGGCGTVTPWAFCRCCWRQLPDELRDAVAKAPAGNRIEAVAAAAVRLMVQTSAHITLPRLPRPDPVSGARTWRGGVQVLGTLLRIPGRTLDAENLDEAEQHAAAVLSAIAFMRGQQKRGAGDG